MLHAVIFAVSRPARGKNRLHGVEAVGAIKAQMGDFLIDAEVKTLVSHRVSLFSQVDVEVRSKRRVQQIGTAHQHVPVSDKTFQFQADDAMHGSP
jgi:putative transposon-encoded protein